MWGKVCLSLILCAVLSGCEKEVLHSELTENEANEVVALLYSADLSAKKVEDGNGLFRVDTDQYSFSAAVSLLQSHGLPRERFESLGEVFLKDGFVSSPLEERARLNYALSQEISKTISNIDGVMLARVHLAVPEKQLLAEKVEPSSASVFVKHRADVDMSEHVGKIKSMVVTAFENLPYENVTVGLFAAKDPLVESGEKSVDVVRASLFGNSPIENSLLVAFAFIGISLVSLGGYLYVRNRRIVPVKATSRDAAREFDRG